MRIESAEPVSQTTGLQSNGFGLTNTAKIIDIVINKMYMNKPGAVIRELSSNAWDAHVEADCTDKPFDIEMPSWLSKKFSIRDYGLGIPHEKFEYIYTNIGGSTKDQSDDMIGGFGLGSKTPFTMVDQFTVVNIHGGIKTTWLCYKNAGSPFVSKLAECETEEPSGLKVEFTFNDNLVDEFTKQLPIQLKYFPVKPNVSGGERKVQWSKLPVGWETQDFFYEEDTSYYRKHSVVMGNVNYDLDPHQLDGNYSSLFQKSLTLKCDIGTVDIPPSRETLEYTKKTKDYLNGKLREIKQKYSQEWEKGLEDKKGYHEIAKHFRDANTYLVSRPKEWEVWGEKLSLSELTSSYFPIRYWVSGQIRSVDRSYAQPYRQTAVSNHRIDQYTVYVNDLGAGGQTHIRNNKGHVAFNGHHFIVDPGICTKKTLEAEVSKVERELKFVGFKPIRLSTKIGMPVKGTAKRAKIQDVFELRNTLGDFGNWHKYTDAPEQGAYYVDLHGKNVQGPVDSEVLQLLKVETGKPVYGIRKRGAKAKDGLTLVTKDHLKPLVPKATKVVENHTYMQELKNFRVTYKRLLEFKWDIPEFQRLARHAQRVDIKLSPEYHEWGRVLKLTGSSAEVKVPFVVKYYDQKIQPKYGDILSCFNALWDTKLGYTALNKLMKDN